MTLRNYLIAAAAALPLLTGGCIGTVKSIVTAPVKVASKAVDWTTTSQSESDRNYGRRMRQAEAREGAERKAHDKACKKDPNNCPAYDGYRAGPDAKPNRR
jgi:hypothetical protein